ncbi:hypothetical protein AMS68_002630 [Peltaster fructicola]|uniref:Apoptosis regulator Bcl-2 family BH4 domain-containing protein n=1 Tax=Peltaster fructicola TaxID=286661 RepID=A0A6H0XQY2_9PEZI|nr:hypothetical protein AMS68_002630 [Peltaster fructicola]
MFQFRLPSLPDFSSWAAPVIKLPRVEVHDVEERPEKRARTLKHLIKADFINHSILYSQLRFHNHTSHILGSAYILGAESDDLQEIYDAEAQSLEPWADAPGEISKHDWRDFLGKKEYQRAWVDFFEDQLVSHSYDWHSLLNEFLLQGEQPLINNLIAGLAHPLIHLGYAHELSSRTIAIESLALAASCYNDLHIYLDDPKYTRPAKKPSDSLFILLDRVAHDGAFDGVITDKGADGIDQLLANEKATEAVIEYWNSWDMINPKDQFAESQKLAVALLVATRDANAKDNEYDFFAVHLLTSSHAVRVLLPLIPAKWHIPLVRQWWLFTLLVYIAQSRPAINIDRIKLVELDGRDWKFVSNKAVKGRHRTDAHYVKALRSMHEASNTWKDPNRYYLKAAVKFAEEFDGWGGFGSSDTN